MSSLSASAENLTGDSQVSGMFAPQRPLGNRRDDGPGAKFVRDQAHFSVKSVCARKACEKEPGGGARAPRHVRVIH